MLFLVNVGVKILWECIVAIEYLRRGNGHEERTRTILLLSILGLVLWLWVILLLLFLEVNFRRWILLSLVLMIFERRCRHTTLLNGNLYLPWCRGCNSNRYIHIMLLKLYRLHDLLDLFLLCDNLFFKHLEHLFFLLFFFSLLHNWRWLRAATLLYFIHTLLDKKFLHLCFKQSLIALCVLLYRCLLASLIRSLLV